MKLYDLISNMKFIGIKNYKEVDIDSLSCNSMEKTTNGAYFCINGTKNDGHDFANEAIKNGAVCLIVERFLPEDITQVLVDDVRIAMSNMASTFYETYKSKMKFIGITGTNGKTTTTFLIREILRKLNKRVGLIGTVGQYINNLILPSKLTTPDPIDLHKMICDMENNACEYCIMEVSAHAIALNKVDDILFDIVGFTNLTVDHLDFFLNMENYLNCKAELFKLKHTKLGVVNMYGAGAKEIVAKSDTSIFKMGEKSDFYYDEMQEDVTGAKFKIVYKEKDYFCKTNLIGKYNVENLCLAISILINLGFEIEKLVQIVSENSFIIPGRCNLLKTDTEYSVVIDFAHTPDGIKNVLTALRPYTRGKLICVFGCGGNRDKTKRAEMGEISSRFSDIVVLTSDNPRDENPDVIMDQAEERIDRKKLVRISDRKLAIEYALSICRKDDLVAILGKGCETEQEIKGIKYPFSDYRVVDDYIATHNSSINTSKNLTLNVDNNLMEIDIK